MEPRLLSFRSLTAGPFVNRTGNRVHRVVGQGTAQEKGELWLGYAAGRTHARRPNVLRLLACGCSNREIAEALAMERDPDRGLTRREQG